MAKIKTSKNKQSKTTTKAPTKRAGKGLSATALAGTLASELCAWHNKFILVEHEVFVSDPEQAEQMSKLFEKLVTCRAALNIVASEGISYSVACRRVRAKIKEKKAEEEALEAANVKAPKKKAKKQTATKPSKHSTKRKAGK